MTLFETLISAAVFLVVCSAVLTGVIALQRTFSSSQSYAANHGAEMRVSDYIARDLRQATSVSPAGVMPITMTIPGYLYLDANTGLYVPGAPSVTANGIQYVDNNSNPIPVNTVSYYVSNGSAYRSVNNVALDIADNVQNLQITPCTFSSLGSHAGQVSGVTITITFASGYSYNGTAIPQIFCDETLERNAQLY